MWGIKNEARMEKLLQDVTPLLQNFEMNLMSFSFCYISQAKVNKNLTSLKTWRKKQWGGALRHQKIFSIKKHLALVLAHVIF